MSIECKSLGADPRWVDRTVAFTDIVASTRHLESVGLEAWSGVIERHFRSVKSIVEEHCGTITSFLGDGFMMVFPHPVDAVRSAIHLQDAMRQQHEVEVRIGIASGPVLPMSIGNWLGLCIHRAARLCDATRAGGIMIDEQAFEIASRQVSLPQFPRQTVHVRGCRQPANVRVIEGRCQPPELEELLTAR